MAEGTPLLRVQIKNNWSRGFESPLLRQIRNSDSRMTSEFFFFYQQVISTGGCTEAHLASLNRMLFGGWDGAYPIDWFSTGQD